MTATMDPALSHNDFELPPAVLRGLYSNAQAAEFGLTAEEFAQILRVVCATYLPADAGPSEVSAFVASLHVEDLALARACAKGSESAWNLFLNRYREKLFDAAHSIAREETAARELADSLYADLFGTKTSEGQRISKLNSYTGRGSLGAWLRAVLAQEYVNRYRREKRLVSLEEQTESGRQFQAGESEPVPPPDARLAAATDEALLSLSEEERFILASYYLDGRRLGEIARVLGVHESTISRRMEKIVASTRKRIIKGLRRRGMSAGEAEEALEADVRDLSLDVRQSLVQEKRRQTVP